MSVAALYLFLVVLPNLHEVASGPVLIMPGVLLCFAGGLALIGGTVDEMETMRAMGARCVKAGACLLIVSIVGTIISPSSAQVYAVSGAYITTRADDIAKLPDNLVNAANSWLKDVAEAKEQKKP